MLPPPAGNGLVHDWRVSGGAQRGERVVLEVVQGEDGLDDGGAAFRAAPQLGGQGLPVLELRVSSFANAAQLGLEPVGGFLRGRELPARGLRRPVTTSLSRPR